MLVTANAKINLGLNVVSRRADGYHNIETLFLPISLADEIEITRGQSSAHTLRCTGIDAACPTDDNLVMRAARLVDVPAVDIVLHKRIPTGAGLGGGSSDAAAVLKALNTMFSLRLTDDELRALLRGLGADCPFFVANKAQFAQGIGDILTPVDIGEHLVGKHLLLVKPNTSVSTREVYANITPRSADVPIMQALNHDITSWRTMLRNDFEQTVFATHRDIAQLRDTLYDMGALYAQMSGSGATVFGIFDAPPPAHPFPDDYFIWHEIIKAGL